MKPYCPGCSFHLICAVFWSVALSGCAQNEQARYLPSDIVEWAAGLGISQDEMRSIVVQIRTKPRLQIDHVVPYRFPDGTIRVALAEKRGQGFGISVRFRKVGDRWKEEPELQGTWIE
jgi:hypothetical protein